MSTISASTTSTTAYKVTADTTGALVLQTGAAPTTAVTISSAQVVTLANALPVASGGTGVTTSTGTGAVVLGTSPSISGAVLSSMASSVITSGTAVASTSGTSIDFTSIPSWVKRITVMFNGVSTVTTSDWLIQLGDSGGFETSGYTSLVAYAGFAIGKAVSTSGFICVTSVGSQVWSGQSVITLVSGNIYVQSGCVADGVNYIEASGGTKTLSATLDRVRITTAGGTDTFDAGSVNILFE
jgi:hypothetical protein